MVQLEHMFFAFRMVRTRKPKNAPGQPIEGEPESAKANANCIPRSKAEKKRKILETMPEDALSTVIKLAKRILVNHV